MTVVRRWLRALIGLARVLFSVRALAITAVVLVAATLALGGVAWYLSSRGVLRFEVEDGCLEVLRRGEESSSKDSVVWYSRLFNSDQFRIKHGLTLGGKTIERPDSIATTLQVPFMVRGGQRLVIAEPNEIIGGGLPAEAFRRMIVTHPLKARAVELMSIRDLRGRVTIRTSGEAVAFCRLLTSPATCYYLDGPGVEVVTRDQVNAAFCFGDRSVAMWRSVDCPGMMGVLRDEQDLKRLGIRRASARATRDGFEVRRTLLGEKTGVLDCWLVDVVETVGKDGRYSRRVTRERRAPQSGRYGFFIFHPI